MSSPKPFHYAWVIVLAGALTIFCCFGLARFAFGMLLPAMRDGLGLSIDDMGFLSTGNFAGYLVAVGLLLRNDPAKIGLEPLGRPQAVTYDPTETHGPYSASLYPAAPWRALLAVRPDLHDLRHLHRRHHGRRVPLCRGHGRHLLVVDRFLLPLLGGWLRHPLRPPRATRRADAGLCRAGRGLSAGGFEARPAGPVRLGSALRPGGLRRVPAIMAAAVGDYLGTARAASAFSIITFCFAIGQTIGPGAAGVMAESAGSFSFPYYVAAAINAMALLGTVFLPRPPRDAG